MKYIEPTLYEKIQVIAGAIAKKGGRALLVGGAVRDMVMNIAIKDIDIEVHGLSDDVLFDTLNNFGHVGLVGKSFGVLRIYGLDVDWSLPRTDSPGRKPIVVVDPFMSLEDAARRRDLTMNAMFFDIGTQELIDFFQGQEDIKNKILRAPDIRFFEQDPLRFYRVMQFTSRFAMYPDQELNSVCEKMDIRSISRERIEQEFRKMLLLSERPSLGIRWLRRINRLHEVVPELAATIGIMQNPQWHPEGDVFEHTMQVLDAAAIIVRKYDNEFDKLVLLYAALCHDLGKTTTTVEVKGVLKSIGHEIESKKYAKTMMKRITHDVDLINAVASLVLHHMAPLQFVSNKAQLPAYKRLANKLDHRVTMEMLIDLCLADKRGRNGEGHLPLSKNFEEVELFKKQVEAAGVFTGKEKPILKGLDLLDVFQPGPQLGRALAYAYELQIDKSIRDKDYLKECVLKKLKN